MDSLQLIPKRPRSAVLDDNSELNSLSELPDDILIDILDKLPMEDAMTTSFLSKRWKDLWKYKSNIELGNDWVSKTGKDVLPSLQRILCYLKEQKLHCLSVSIRYCPSMLTDMELLFTYASIKNAKEIYIDFNARSDSKIRQRRRCPYFFLTECEDCVCSSLVKLSLKSVQLDTLPARFVALRELFLERVILGDYFVEIVTTNCPSLSLLCLCNCNPKVNLEIVIAATANLLQLIIREEITEVANTTELSIRAENVKVIEFVLALPRKGYKIEGALVCSEVRFRLNQMHQSRQAMRVSGLGIKGKFTDNFVGLLEKFKAAETITLSSWCIQVLSIELIVRRKCPLSFDLRHLTLETGLELWEFLGITYLLLSARKLESLVVVMGDTAEISCNHPATLMSSVGYNVFDQGLPALKTVEFKNFSGNYESWEADNFDLDKFFRNYSSGDFLVWNLMHFTVNLKKIVFTTREKSFELNQFEKYRLMPKLSQAS
ncbi:putative F-box/LRR-repeat protein At3g18150 [Amaranthus tricolor]|uniref:putative F-box/LRR-repeat protein At3g18150 n=1 Tax=Amaranthus tricolor TaxID=29722 RepID=UPI002586ECB6|nr:putative F-box/LRR-repeat protein At3g18150 [Amaranthus tricolor]